MGINIDWDNYELLELDGYTLEDLREAVESVREHMDYLLEQGKTIPDDLADILEELTEELIESEE